ncbi:MAG: RNA polymerase sigma factor [Flavisolibacter sp.]
MPFLKTISSPGADEELVAAYQKEGDLAILGELFQRYMDLVYGVCLKYLKDAENAQDSTLAIFEELVTKLLKHEVAHFRPWLYTLAKNHCLMRLRSEKKLVSLPFDPERMQFETSMHPDGVLEKEENFRKMEQCLEQLATEQRKTIELFYLEGKCYHEITTMTGMEWNKVRSHIQNGRRQLKICMEAQKNQSIVKK